MSDTASSAVSILLGVIAVSLALAYQSRASLRELLEAIGCAGLPTSFLIIAVLYQPFTQFYPGLGLALDPLTMVGLFLFTVAFALSLRPKQPA